MRNNMDDADWITVYALICILIILLLVTCAGSI